MKNADVIKQFVRGVHKGAAGNLSIEVRNGRTALINYSTVIAERMDDSGVIHFNSTKYSMSTTRIQNELRHQMFDAGVNVIEYTDIDMHTKCLI